jgi:hypothetical protein
MTLKQAWLNEYARRQARKDHLESIRLAPENKINRKVVHHA